MKPTGFLLLFSLLLSSTIQAAKTTSPLKKQNVKAPTAPKTPKLSVKNANQPRKQSEAEVGSVGKAYGWYLRQCTDNPIPTKSTTCAIVCSIGDILAQKLESHLAKRATFIPDLKRLGSFFLCGLLYVGPFVHLWYDILIQMGRWMERTYNSTKVKQVAAQLFVDQTVGVALFFPLYFYVFEYMEGLVYWRKPSFAHAHEKCLEQISKVFLMQYRVFPLSNAINFGFVPEQLRVLFSNSVSVFWNIYLCTILAD